MYDKSCTSLQLVKLMHRTLKILRVFRSKGERLARSRMKPFKLIGMKRKPPDKRLFRIHITVPSLFELGKEYRLTAAVQRIADNRVTGGCKVCPNLMRPAGNGTRLK